ncbi:uncharacterized protein FIBRA_01977 [Fibroporia radiculosa]|uniref:Cytochrome P450 n=1 Tax=Fibroporia radiculosa TaxID=599839 RepID=J4HU67_9APHY|nr:uncharacterized protein FIBRA_01977 [Fibroporia radiculosa]CCL99952.1 predicted protein [Fibroporia radiculosa]
MDLASNPIVLAAIIGLLLCAFVVSHTRLRNKKLPPGPSPLPIIGNLHQLPLEYKHQVFAEWAKKYGDIFYLNVFHKPTVVISSVQVAHDLLEKRGSKYSDRPRMVMLNEIMGFDSVLSILPYGDQWRLHRRWFQSAFQANTAEQNYRSLQERGVRRLLSVLLDAPADFMLHIKRYSGSAMMEIAYGHPSSSPDVDFMDWADKLLTETFELGSAGSTLIDFFPILKNIPSWMPGNGLKRRACNLAAMVRIMLDEPYERVQRALAAGSTQPSFLSELLDEYSKKGSITLEDEYNLKGAAAMVYIAGTDTTISVMMSFVLAMVLYPDVYRKAQAEISRVVEQSRLPVFEDRSSMPYLECVLKEVYRWGCPLPFVIPHRLLEDDEYRGYHLPAGSLIIPNVWAMFRDPDLFSDPDRFMPERFEEFDFSSNPTVPDPSKAAFGFGRRFCPGRNFGDSTVWLFAASVLSTMDICKAKDEFGREVTPKPLFSDAFVSHPLPFKCDFKPRSLQAIETIVSSSKTDIA